MAILWLFLLNIFLCGQRAASAEVEGNCEHPATQENLNFTKYMGTWYGALQYPADVSGVRCYVVMYSTFEGKVEYLSSFVKNGSKFGKTHSGETDISEADKGKINYDGPLKTYWILNTDYTSYTVVYVCLEKEKEKSQAQLYVFTRDEKPSDDVVKKYNKIIDDLGLEGISSSSMGPIKFENCDVR